MKLLPTHSLQLEFPSINSMLNTWARHVAEGGLFIPTPSRRLVDAYHLKFVVDEHTFLGQRATVLDRKPPENQAGFWATVEAGPALSALIELHARKQKQGRAVAAPPGAPRVTPRYSAVLEVAFENLPSLAAQYASDISRGGLFIRCESQPALRSRIELRLTLPNAETIRLDAEVVHSAPTGVGVQFLDVTQLGPISQLLEKFQQRRPRVLVVDDEAIWRSTLARALTQLGVDVQLASNGREGLIKLIDGFFDLDLAIIDLHMPDIDGRGLIERVRKQGGESALKLFLFSAAGADDLDAMRAPGLATGVFSKLDPFEHLMARIAAELPNADPAATLAASVSLLSASALPAPARGA